MADKFKKIDKRYTLSDSSVNSYGFRLLTDGYQKDRYASNAIGYYMHLRDAGVLLRWEDIQVDGDTVSGKPVINLSNPRAQQTIDEIESGFLNAASMGHFVVLEMSDDDALKLPGQTGPTVTKWFNRECSLVDIPGNFNSLTLFDKDDNEISLADFTNNHFTHMKQIILSAAQLAVLNLKADSDAAAVETAITGLKAEADKVPGLTQQLADATSAKATAEAALAAAKKAATEKEVEDLLASAVADKKATPAMVAELRNTYAANPAGLKALVAALPSHTNIVSTLKGGAETKGAEKDWDTLDQEGKLEDLKATNVDLFKVKYKERFGKDYEGK